MFPDLHFLNLHLSTYFLTISLDFCFLLFCLKHRSQKLGFPVRLSLDIGIFSAIGGFIGARLFHVFYEHPEFYFSHPLFIFKIWLGGFVFLPGIISGLFVGIGLLKFHKQKILQWLDLFSPIISLGYAIGRWACFFQGCCYGTQTNSIFGVHFEQLQNNGENFARLPVQIFTSITEFLIFLGLLFIEKNKSRSLKSGQLFTFWIIAHSINRMIMELLRDDPRGPLFAGFGVSFWLSLILFSLGSTALIFRKNANNQIDLL